MSDHQQLGAKMPQNRLEALNWVLSEVKKSSTIVTGSLGHILTEKPAAASGLGLGKSPAAISNLKLALAEMKRASGALELSGQSVCAQIYDDLAKLFDRCLRSSVVVDAEIYKSVKFCCNTVNAYVTGVSVGRTYASQCLVPVVQTAVLLAGRQNFHPSQVAQADLSKSTLPLNWALLSGFKSADPPSDFEKVLLKLFRGDKRAKLTFSWLLKEQGQTESDFGRASLNFFGSFFLQAYAHDLLEVDIYVKRTAAKLAQWHLDRQLADGEITELLAEVRYFLRRCEGARVDEVLPALSELEESGAIQLSGRSIESPNSELWVFEPDLVAEVLSSLASAKRAWSQVTSGDFRAANDASRSFSAVHRATEKLGPYLSGVTKALEQCVNQVSGAKANLTEEISLEVATALLFLDSVLDDQNGLDLDIEAKIESIQQRLEKAYKGEPIAPLQRWMETLFHRSAERQSMGNVAGELRQISGEIESHFEKLFGQPDGADSSLILQKLNVFLLKMKGVLGVIGLESAVQTVAHLQQRVADWRPVSRSDSWWKETVSNVGANMATLGLMVDMLGYQPALASRLFRFDLSNNTLCMGYRDLEKSASAPPTDADVQATAPVQASISSDPIVVDAELQDVFFQEAQDVVDEGMDQVSVLARDSKDLATLVSLRRGFHTLKGRARMVGLTELGEAAWVMEQLLNEQLTNEFEPISENLCALSKDALGVIRRWANFLSRGHDPEWTAAPIQKAAAVLRAESVFRPIEMPPVQFSGTNAPEAAVSHVVGLELRETSLPSKGQSDHGEPPAGIVVLDAGQPPIEPEGWNTLKTVDAGADSVTQDAAATLDDEFDEEFSSTVVESRSISDDVSIAELDGDQNSPLYSLASSSSELTRSAALEQIVSPLNTDQSSAEDAAEQFKWIGGLRVRLNLYSVFLQEADELSRALETRADEWILAKSVVLAQEAADTAHALAGCSATVGFEALAQLCRDIEAGFGVAVALGESSNICEEPLKSGVETVRHLLHQFAAGFLREPEPKLSQTLKDLLQFGALEPSVELIEEETEFTLEEPVEAFEVAASTEVTVDSEGSVNLEVKEEASSVDASFTEASGDLSILALFTDEAAELIPQVAHQLHLWLSPTGDEAGRQEVLRGLHTLKGSARIAGALHVGDHVHQLETLVEQSDPTDRNAARAMFDALDRIENELQHPLGQPAELAIVPATFPILDKPEIAGVQDSASTLIVAPAVALEIPRAATLMPATESALTPRVLPVRVNTRLLDTVVNRVGEVIGTRARIKDELHSVRGALSELNSNITRLRAQLRELEIQAESQMQSRLVFHKDAESQFDPLELDRYTRVQELTRMMAESVNDVATVQLNLTRHLDSADDGLIEQGRQSKELQRELLRTRIVPFETMTPRLVRTARQAANDTDKLVHFELSGGALEIDRQQLEKIGPSLEHLIRNAVAHGIESPSQRLEKGKPETGRIELSVRQEQNDIVIEMHDDGRGLNIEDIQNKAVGLGLVSPDAQINDQQAFELVCLPGFTTTTSVSELAGRGIGMDVVKSSINASGGRLEGFNAPGRGLTLRMMLPLTTATTQVLLVKHGDIVTAIPVNMIEQVLRFVQKDLEQGYNTRQITHSGESVPFYWIGALLTSSNRSSIQQFRSQPVVVVRSAGRRVAVHVDAIVGQSEVLVRNVGEQLAHLPGLTGISILPSGQVVLIYNPVALLLVYGGAIDSYGADLACADQMGVDLVRSVSTAAGAVNTKAVKRSVLVVDDSITVRKFSQRLLERAGYKVTLAADGFVAIGLLRKELVDQLPFVILADIEMPRMDGFEMVRTLKGDERLAQIPVIMITSRLAEKHREVAQSLGVQHYMGKPFVEDQLLALVAQYHEEAVTVTQ